MDAAQEHLGMAFAKRSEIDLKIIDLVRSRPLDSWIVETVENDGSSIDFFVDSHTVNEQGIEVYFCVSIENCLKPEITDVTLMKLVPQAEGGDPIAFCYPSSPLVRQLYAEVCSAIEMQSGIVDEQRHSDNCLKEHSIRYNRRNLE